MGATWTTTEQVAWTEHDGPDRPPRGVTPVLGFAFAAVLSTVFAGMVLTDDLCPEHRLWVQLLGGAALVGCVTAAVAWFRGWSSAPLLAAGTSACGLAIGLIDVAHNATRGWVIAGIFAVTLLASVWTCLQQLTMRQWQRAQATDDTVDTDDPSTEATDRPLAHTDAAAQ
jgi:hypothetical protein